MRAVWPKPSLAVRPPTVAVGISEVSRFSCMKFLGVSGVFDYAGLNRNSRYRSGSCCLPRITRTSASGLHLFGALLPTPPIPLFTLRRVPRGTQRKTRGRADRYSLLVRILHSLLHAGLSRRTAIGILQQLGWAVGRGLALSLLAITAHSDVTFLTDRMDPFVLA